MIFTVEESAFLMHGNAAVASSSRSTDLRFQAARLKPCPDTNLPWRLQCVIPKLGAFQPSEAVPLHARSLVPLVRARDFGMTPVLENFGDGLLSLSCRAKKIIRFANDLRSRGICFSRQDREGHGFQPCRKG